MLTPSKISASVARIDRAYEPDPTAVIECLGRTLDGHTIDLLITNYDDHGPEVWPGHSFLHPYGHVPLLRSIKVS